MSEESKTSSHGGSAHQSTQAEGTNPWTSFQAKVAGLEMSQGQKGRGNRPRVWKECPGVEWNSGDLSSPITQLNLVMSTLGLSLLICQMERVIFNPTPLMNALGILLSLNIQHSVLISL